MPKKEIKEYFSEIIKDFTGKTTAEAKEYGVRRGFTFRIISIDNKPCVITNEENPWRLNLTIENDIVVLVDMG